MASYLHVALNNTEDKLRTR